MAGRVIGVARIVDRYPHTKTPPIPRDRWFDVVKRDDVNPLEGYVWLDVDGHMRHIWAQFLEIDVAQGDA